MLRSIATDSIDHWQVMQLLKLFVYMHFIHPGTEVQYMKKSPYSAVPSPIRFPSLFLLRRILGGGSSPHHSWKKTTFVRLRRLRSDKLRRIRALGHCQWVLNIDR